LKLGTLKRLRSDFIFTYVSLILRRHAQRLTKRP
jgi:hypothetical protein